jgi:hypothetical protein
MEGDVAPVVEANQHVQQGRVEVHVRHLPRLRGRKDLVVHFGALLVLGLAHRCNALGRKVVLRLPQVPEENRREKK